MSIFSNSFLGDRSIFSNGGTESTYSTHATGLATSNASSISQNESSFKQPIAFSFRSSFSKGTVSQSVSSRNSAVASSTLLSSKSAVTLKRVDAKSAYSFVDSIGVNTHLHYYDTPYGNFSLVKSRLQELGVRHIRDGGSDPTWIGRINELAAVGIRSTIVVDPNIGVGPDATYSIQSPGYTIKRLLKNELSSSVDAVEILNEFDFFYSNYFHNGKQLNDSTWASYLRDFTRDTYKALSSDPATDKISIIGPSFVYPDSGDKVGMLNKWVDYGNMHPYNYPSFPGNGNLEQEMENRSKPFANLPLVATEGGYHTASSNSGNAVSEEVQAKYTPRMFLENFNHGVSRTFSYELIDQWPNPDEKEANFGLLRNDGSPKPAFTAQKNLITLLNDSSTPFTPGTLRYSITGDTQNVHQTLLQKSNGNFFLIMWLEVPSGNQDTTQTVTLNLKTPINQATTYLPNQSINPIKKYNSPTQLALNVPDYPLVIKLVP